MNRNGVENGLCRISSIILKVSLLSNVLFFLLLVYGTTILWIPAHKALKCVYPHCRYSFANA